MLLSIVFVFFLIPETKAIPLEAMDQLFEVKPVWKANETVLRDLQIQDEEFRHDAEGAGLHTMKTKMEGSKIENVEV